MPRSLIVEDDHAIAELLGDHLRRVGHRVSICHDGDSAVDLLARETFDLAILDVMLPGASGLEVCQCLRASAVSQPVVLVLTARTDERDVIAGFDAGADDYVRKPFHVKELLARIAALLRLAGRRELASAPALVCGSLSVRRRERIASVDGEAVHLTPKEFDLLVYLALAPGRVLSRSDLLEQVWGYQHSGYARTVDAHITRIRRKLGEAGMGESPIETVHGLGYRFRC